MSPGNYCIHDPMENEPIAERGSRWVTVNCLVEARVWDNVLRQSRRGAPVGVELWGRNNPLPTPEDEPAAKRRKIENMEDDEELEGVAEGVIDMGAEDEAAGRCVNEGQGQGQGHLSQTGGYVDVEMEQDPASVQSSE